MSNILRQHSRKIIAGVVVIGAFAIPGSPLPNIFHTPGVANIEKRWSSGGGSKNHTPAIATRRGDAENVSTPMEKNKGIGSPHWEEHIGGQKPPASSFDKAWNKSHYGSEKGK